MVYKTKIVVMFLVCAFALSVVAFPAFAQQSTINLTSAYIYYTARSGSSSNSTYLPAVGLHNYAYVQDIDIYEPIGFYFNVDTRFLPSYTYHFQYRIYLGEDSDDANMRFLPPDSLYLFEQNGTDAFVIYPTVKTSQSNTSTLIDVYFRLDAGTERGNILAAGNYVKFGQVLSPPTGIIPFEYDGIYVSVHTFEGFYDHDGSELDAMLAGLSDVRRGIDAVGNKLDRIDDKLDDIKDDIKSGYEYEEQRANEEGDERLSEGEESLLGVLDLSAFTRALSNLWGALSYEGFDCEFVIPEVRLPQFDGFGGNVLIEETSTDFGFWFQRPELQTPLLVVKFLTCFGAAWYFFTDVTKFMSSLFEGGNDE